MKHSRNHRLKILCIADDVDSLVYSESIKSRYGDVDAIISCGDLKRNYYEYIVSNLNKPFLYVLGNHSQFSMEKSDPSEYRFSSDADINKLFDGGILADGKCIYLKKLNLITVGFGGSRRYNNGSNQYTELQMMLRILNIIPKLLFNKLFRGRYLDILISHAPPRQINDLEDPCHKGFMMFRWFLRRFKPSCMVHGHIHLYNNNHKRIQFYMGIPVINAYKHYLLKLPDNGADNEHA